MQRRTRFSGHVQLIQNGIVRQPMFVLRSAFPFFGEVKAMHRLLIFIFAIASLALPAAVRARQIQREWEICQRKRSIARVFKEGSKRKRGEIVALVDRRRSRRRPRRAASSIWPSMDTNYYNPRGSVFIPPRALAQGFPQAGQLLQPFGHIETSRHTFFEVAQSAIH